MKEHVASGICRALFVAPAGFLFPVPLDDVVTACGGTSSRVALAISAGLVFGIFAGIAGALERRAAVFNDPRPNWREALLVGAACWAIAQIGYWLALLPAVYVSCALSSGDFTRGFGGIEKFFHLYSSELFRGGKTFAIASSPFALHAFAGVSFQRFVFRAMTVWLAFIPVFALARADVWIGSWFGSPALELRLGEETIVHTLVVAALLPFGFLLSDACARRVRTVLD